MSKKTLALCAFIALISWVWMQQKNSDDKTRSSRVDAESEPAPIPHNPASSPSATATPAHDNEEQTGEFKAEEMPPEVSESLSEMFRKLPLMGACKLFDGTKTSPEQFRRLTEGRGRSFLEASLKHDTKLAVSNMQWRLPMNARLMELSTQLGQDAHLHSEYLKAAQLAKAELEAYLPIAKDLEHRAYYALMLGRAILKAPRIAGDANVTEFCKALGNLHVAFSAEQMHAELGNFLSRAQVSAEEIGYDSSFAPSTLIKQPGPGWWAYDTPALRRAVSPDKQ